MTGLIMLLIGLALLLAGLAGQQRWPRVGLAVMTIGALTFAIGFGLAGLTS